MRFVIFRCIDDPDWIIVTDKEHLEAARGEICPSGGGIEHVGNFEEMGDDRVAFDEKLAKNSIQHQGFYLFQAKGFAPIPPAPEMPG